MGFVLPQTVLPDSLRRTRPRARNHRGLHRVGDLHATEAAVDHYSSGSMVTNDHQARRTRHPALLIVPCIIIWDYPRTFTIS